MKEQTNGQPKCTNLDKPGIDSQMDPLDIRWRVWFGMKLGLDRREAYEIALGLAGVGGHSAKDTSKNH